MWNPFRKRDDMLKLENNLLVQKCNRLKAELEELKHTRNIDPTTVIEAMLGRGIEWYDYKKLDNQSQYNYWSDAQNLLQNPVFQNETNAYYTDLLKYIALETRSHEETMANRTLIVGIEALKNRIESIENPRKSREPESLHDPI